MNEELKKLQDKLSHLGNEENWDELIVACTALISMDGPDGVKAEAYRNRADIYRKKNDYDKAIKDYKEAIKLGSKDTDTYCSLGSAYVMGNKYDKAIKAFDKAINLDSKNVNAYCFRSNAYSMNMEYDKAIKDCKEAIKLAPKNANTYYFLGLVYFGGKKYDKAIKAFDDAIKLDSSDADAYHFRGSSYHGAGNINKAFDDYVEAGKYDEDLKSILPAIYIASRLVCIFKDSEVPSALKSIYLGLWNIVERVRSILSYRDSKDIAHYTSLDVLKNLVDTNTNADADTNHHSFRLYNAAYMNDPEEGRVFFDVMNDRKVMKKQKIDLEKMFYSGENAQLSPAYIGSFVKIEPDKDKNKDKLFLWRTYGRDNDEEAAGACLIFDRNQFADSPPLLKMGEMYRSTERSDFSQKPELYKICYKGEIEDKKGLAENLTALSLMLKDISDFCQSEKEKPLVDELAQLVRELLDNIRFLFKADHYQQEEEVRVIVMSYQVGKETPSNRQVDAGRMPPRFYWKTPEEVKPSEVILGPRAVRVPEWQQWLKEQGINKAEPSRIPFGKSV